MERTSCHPPNFSSDPAAANRGPGRPMQLSMKIFSVNVSNLRETQNNGIVAENAGAK